MSTGEHHEEQVEALEDEFAINYSTDVETTCSICQAEFLDPEDLSIHLRQIHKITDSSSKFCMFCLQKYTDLVSFAEHFRDNHLGSLFYCVHCLRAFTDEDTRRLHEKKHKRSNKSAYCCSQCPAKFGNLRDLKTHDFDQHNNNDDGVMMQPYLPFLSSILNVKAETVLLSLRSDTVYICVSCGHSTSSLKQYIEHSKNKKCISFACSTCSNVYKKKNSMKYHVIRCSGNYNYRTMECPDCKLVFNKYLYKEHQKVCKVIKCFNCGTYYNTMYELTEHQSKEHPLSVELITCNFCWKQCVGTVALQKHIDRSHKPELHLYKYMCLTCKIPFKHPQKLLGHFFSKHRDLEPYTCKICNKKFRVRKRFTLHIKLAHSSTGFVEFDENYHVFFTEKKSENPFVPKSLYEKEQDIDVFNKADDSNISLLNMNSEMSVTDTEGNQTEAEAPLKPNLKRKRVSKAHTKDPEEIITVESSDEESLLVVRKRVLKQQKSGPKLPKKGRWRQKQLDINKKRFTCNICNKYCYTYQNYNHHVSLHSKKDYKKCIKCSKVFRSKEKLKRHVELKHASSKLTDTLKYMLEKRKKGEKITDDLPMSEKFRRTIKKVEFEEPQAMAKIKEVDDRLSVQKFIENFTPEENKIEIAIENDIIFKVVHGVQKEPAIKLTKFEMKPAPANIKLAMPVKFKPGQYEKTKASVRLVQQVSIIDDDIPDNNYKDDNYFEMDRNDSIPEVAEEIMLEGSEEVPKTTHIPHKIVIPNLPGEYKDLRIAHLLPQAPFYKIVKVDEVLNKSADTKTKRHLDIKLPDGTKLVNTNPLAHLLGKTPIEKVLEPMKNKYYKSKVRDFQGLLAEAISNLDKPVKIKKKKPVSEALTDVGSQASDAGSQASEAGSQES